MPLNIVFTGSFAYPSGMAGTRRVQLFIDYLNKTGSQTSVLLFRNSNENLSLYGKKGKFNQTEYVYLKPMPFLPFKALINGILFLSAHKKNNSPNILFIYDGIIIENLLLAIIAKLVGYLVIVDMVEDYSYNLEKSTIKQRIKLKSGLIIEKYAKRIIDGMVVISFHLEEKYRKMYNNRIRIARIPGSTDLNKKIKREKKSSGFIFAYAGTFGNKDGVPHLIEAFKKVNNLYPDTELHLSGKGNNPEMIIAKVQNKNIKYRGFMDDSAYHEFIVNADVLCIPRIGSVYANAGFPFKLGEFLATGNPVIASNVSDLAFYFENKKDILLVAPENIEELTNAMIFLIQHPEQADSIGKNGRATCELYFNVEINGQKLVKFFEKL